MRNSALVGWWWGCGRSLAKLEVPLLNFLPFCPVGHSLQFTGNVYFFRMMTFQFGCLGFSVFELAVAFQCVEFFSVAASFSMCWFSVLSCSQFDLICSWMSRQFMVLRFKFIFSDVAFRQILAGSLKHCVVTSLEFKVITYSLKPWLWNFLKAHHSHRFCLVNWIEMPLPLTLQQLFGILQPVPGMTLIQSMQGYNKGGYNRFNANFPGRTAVLCFCAWQLSQCWWMENGRRAFGCKCTACCDEFAVVAWDSTTWSQKDRIHHVHYSTFASVAVSVYTCVHFPAGSELCGCKFHLMSLDSKSWHSLFYVSFWRWRFAIWHFSWDPHYSTNAV